MIVFTSQLEAKVPLEKQMRL